MIGNRFKRVGIFLLFVSCSFILLNGTSRYWGLLVFEPAYAIIGPIFKVLFKVISVLVELAAILFIIKQPGESQPLDDRRADLGKKPKWTAENYHMFLSFVLGFIGLVLMSATRFTELPVDPANTVRVNGEESRPFFIEIPSDACWLSANQEIQISIKGALERGSGEIRIIGAGIANRVKHTLILEKGEFSRSVWINVKGISGINFHWWPKTNQAKGELNELKVILFCTIL